MVKPLNSELEAAADYNPDALHPFAKRANGIASAAVCLSIVRALKVWVTNSNLPQSKPVSTCVQPFNWHTIRW